MNTNATNTGGGEDGRVQSALQALQSILINNENVEAWAIQRRIFALRHRRVLVAATSGRFIAVVRRLLSGFDPVDLRWQDLTEVKINVGLFGATLTIRAGQGGDLAINSESARQLVFSGLRKSQAQEVYRICQAHDQAWREKRRVREIEELRARSGGLQIVGGGTAAPAGAGGSESSDSSMERLQQARKMLEAKLITDSEFEAIKARIINSA